MTFIGQFVESRENGFGKIIDSKDGKYVVEFFISPWKRTSQIVSLKASMVKRLPRQTRVFVENNGKWRMGRMEMEISRDEGGYDYRVRFPNRLEEEIPGEELFVRCLKSFDDPTAMLANGAMETQFWHDRRAAFSNQLLTQRAVSRGLYSLLSSSIEFVPHQIEVARRVLEDPLQRYVLADEVGMGKTIEAGLILRQYLLTSDSGDVWVIVPPTLVQQWRRELNQKFSISDFPDRVQIFTFDEVEKFLGREPKFIIVDEAHHIVSKTIPAWLQSLGRQAERLLLLTATPSLTNTKVLLHLLHLIDPHAYLNIEEADFARRLEEREQLGIFLRGFRADTSPVLLRQRLKQLAERFANDPEAKELGLAISRSLEVNDRDGLQEHISSLRSHIADVYRIHQRLIRTRRRDAAQWVFRPRGPLVDPSGAGDLSNIFLTWTKEVAIPELAEILEQWRLEFAVMHPRGTPGRIETRRIFVSLFEALSRGSSAFLRVVESLPEEFGSSLRDQISKRSLPPLPSSEIAERSREVAKAIAISMRQIAATNGKPPRVVVFASDRDDLDRCGDALSRELGNPTVLIASSVASTADIAEAFESNKNAQVLLCGRGEEEGLNLHFTDLLVHLDLPFSPERIEQRIGRLDRFGRKADFIRQRVVLPGQLDDSISYWDAWMDVLADGFHIFNTPLTDMQFLLSELTDELADEMLEDGAAGLRNSILKVRERLELERGRLDNQYALDRILQDEEGAAQFCQRLEDAEAEEETFSKEAKNWFSDCLKFSFEGAPLKSLTIKWDGDYTLLPANPWAHVFKGSLNGTKTFSRRVSNRSKSRIQLLRVGSPLYVAAEKHLRWEDRGTAFATWRREPAIGDATWFAFKLCYQIEGQLPDGVNPEERIALQARIDGYLPPWVETLYVGSDLKPITDVGMLDILGRPYKAGNMTSGDLNIGSRHELLQQVIDSALFNRLCHTVRDESEDWLLKQEKFCATVREAASRGKIDLERRLRRFKMRQAVLKGERAEEAGLAREVELNQLLVEGLGTPKIRLDSIGVIVVSGQPPQNA